MDWHPLYLGMKAHLKSVFIYYITCRSFLSLHFSMSLFSCHLVSESYFKELDIGEDALTFRSVQFSRSVMSNSLHPMNCSTPGFPGITSSWSLLKLMSIESVMPSNHLILSYPLLLPPSVFPSIRVFYSESVLHIRWPKYWSFSFSISPSNEYSGQISFRMDWFDLL